MQTHTHKHTCVFFPSNFNLLRTLWLAGNRRLSANCLLLITLFCVGNIACLGIKFTYSDIFYSGNKFIYFESLGSPWKAWRPWKRLGNPRAWLGPQKRAWNPKKKKKDRNLRNILVGIVETTYGTPEKGSRTPWLRKGIRESQTKAWSFFHWPFPVREIK